MVLVEVAGDPVAGRHGPIAKPAGRLHCAQRKGQKSRFDLRLANLTVVGRGRRRREKGGRADQPAENMTSGTIVEHFKAPVILFPKYPILLICSRRETDPGSRHRAFYQGAPSVPSPER